MYPDQTVTWHKPLVTKVCNQTGEHGGEEHDSGEDDDDNHTSDEHYISMYLPDGEPSPQPTNPLMDIYTTPPATFFVRWDYIILLLSNDVDARNRTYV